MICRECETVAHCTNYGCIPKTTKQTEALKLALAALEEVNYDQAYATEIIAIREALAEESSGTEQPANQLDDIDVVDIPAQPQQEPNIPGLEADSDQLRAELRNSLSWGMVYGPLIPAHQWDEMREMQIETSIHRLNAATKPRPDAVVTSLVAGPDGVIRAGLDRQLPLMTEVYISPSAQPQQEPVAWVLEWTFNGEERGRRLYDDETHCVFDAGNDGGVCRPLVYGDTSPAAQRKPLTDDEIWDAYSDCPAEISCHINDLYTFARAIEAAHGIKGETK